MWSGGSEFDDLLKDFLNVAKEEAATGTFSMRLPTGTQGRFAGTSAVISRFRWR